MKMTSLLTRKATCGSPLLSLEYGVVGTGTAIDKVCRPETEFEYNYNIC